MTISERVIEIVRRELDGAPVSNGTRFECMEMDSLDYLHMLTEIETKLGIEIKAPFVFQTVGQLIARVEQLCPN